MDKLTDEGRQEIPQMLTWWSYAMEQKGMRGTRVKQWGNKEERWRDSINDANRNRQAGDLST